MLSVLVFVVLAVVVVVVVVIVLLVVVEGVGSPSSYFIYIVGT